MPGNIEIECICPNSGNTAATKDKLTPIPGNRLLVWLHSGIGQPGCDSAIGKPAAVALRSRAGQASRLEPENIPRDAMVNNFQPAHSAAGTLVSRGIERP